MSGANARIKGQDVFRESPRGVTHLGTEWAMNPVVRGDIQVEVFLDSVGGYRYKARRDALLEILDIDLDWHMHRVSDGERRRVQLCMGLMAPWDVLLLDEITVDLDVQVRDDLLSFLKRDSEERKSTIICSSHLLFIVRFQSNFKTDATHIFDGLSDFPTHVAHMRFGEFIQEPTPWPSASLSSTSLYEVALAWLRDDMRVRRELEASGGRKLRGPRRGADVPTDSETFYKK